MAKDAIRFAANTVIGNVMESLEERRLLAAVDQLIRIWDTSSKGFLTGRNGGDTADVQVSGIQRRGVHVELDAAKVAAALGGGKTLNPMTDRVTWAFNDSASDYSTLPGFNAAHVYDTTGVKTIKVTVEHINADKTISKLEDTVTLNVASESASTAEITPDGDVVAKIKTAIEAGNKIILFNGGQTYKINRQIQLDVTSAGTGFYQGIRFATKPNTGGQAILQYTGSAKSSLFRLRYDSSQNSGYWNSNITFENLTFDTYTPGYNYENSPKQDWAYLLSKDSTFQNVVVRDCTINRLGGVVEINQVNDSAVASNTRWVQGLLLEGNKTVNATSIERYFSFTANSASNVVLLGNKTHNSIAESPVRVAGSKKVLIYDNDLADANLPGQVAAVSGGDQKTVLKVVTGEWLWIAKNRVTDGSDIWLGPLNGSDAYEPSNPNRIKTDNLSNVVFEANDVYMSVELRHGLKNAVLRNNTFRDFDYGVYRPVLSLTQSQNNLVEDGHAFSFPDTRVVSNLAIVNNTRIGNSAKDSYNYPFLGVFIKANKWDGKARFEKLVLANNLTIGSSAINVDLSGGPTNNNTKNTALGGKTKFPDNGIHNNVWVTPSSGVKSFNYGNAAGSLVRGTLSNWNADMIGAATALYDKEITSGQAAFQNNVPTTNVADIGTLSVYALWDREGRQRPLTKVTAGAVDRLQSAPVTAPNSPTNILATSVTSSSVTLSWEDKSSNETGFHVYAVLKGQGLGDPAATVSSTTSTTITGLAADTEYDFVVASYNTAGEGRSALITARTSGSVQPPTPPVMSIAVNGAREIQLSWPNTPNNQTSFVLQRATSASGPWNIVDGAASLPGTSTGFIDRTVSPITTYYYRVFAIRDALASAASNVVSGTTPAETTDTTTPALDDTFIRDGTVNGPANYGSLQVLEVKESDDTAYERIAFIRFDVQDLIGLSNIDTIKLRVYGATNTTTGPLTTVQVAGATGNWDESVITYDNFEASGEPVIGSVLGEFTLTSTTKSWFEVDVTPFVRAALTAGDDRVTLALKGKANSNPYGMFDSSESTSGNGPQLKVTYVGAAAAPAAPTGLTAAAPSPDVVQLDWDDNSNFEDGYRLERSTDSWSTVEVVTTTGPNATSYQDTTVTPGVTYKYRVVAFNDAGDTAGTTPADATVTTPSPTPTPTPTIGTATLVGLLSNAAQVRVTFTNNASNASNLRLERSVDGEDFAIVAANIEPSATSVDDLAAPLGATVLYRVVAIANGVTSDPSSQASVNTPTSDVDFLVGAKEDAFVRGGSYSGTSAGNDANVPALGLNGTILEAKTETASWTRLSYMKFDLTSLTGVAKLGQIKLRIYGVSSSATNLAVGVYGVPNSVSWDESQISYDTSPSLSGLTAIQNVTVTSTSQWFEVDVSTFIKSELAAGRTSATIALQAEYSLASVARFNSSEASAKWPRLAAAIVEQDPPESATALVATKSGGAVNLAWTDNSGNETGFKVQRRVIDPVDGPGEFQTIAVVGAGVTSTSDTTVVPNSTYEYRIVSYIAVSQADDVDASPSNTASITTDAPGSGNAIVVTTQTDAYVRGGATDTDSNFGTESVVRVKWANDAAVVRHGYFKFAISDLVGQSNINRIVFRVYGGTHKVNAEVVPVNIYGLSGTTPNSWGESTITYTNRPSTSGLTPLTSAPLQFVSGDQWYEFDVTNFVQAELTAGRTTISFALQGTVTTDAYVELNSSEAADFRPEIVATLSALPAPTDLTATASSPTSVTVRWADRSSNETGFVVERKTGSGSYSTLVTLGAGQTSYVDNTVSANTTYRYRVRAINTPASPPNNTSGFSNEAVVTTPVTLPPASPNELTANVNAVASTTGTVALSWTDNSGNETGFIIERKVGEGGTYQSIGTVSANATSYIDTAAPLGVELYYRVLAVGANTTAPSSSLQVFTPTSGKQLTINGSSANDTLLLRFDSSALKYVFTNTVGDTVQFSQAVINAITLNGNAGNDYIAVDSTVTKWVAINGQSGNDTLSGGSGADQLNGGDGADSLYGNKGDDALNGGTGNDLLFGGENNDVLDGGGGSDDFRGEAGLDTVTYASRTAAVTAVFNSRSSGESGEQDLIYTSVERITGGAGADNLSANSVSFAVTLTGGAGNDTLKGGSGNDSLDGESNNDLLLHSAGADVMNGNDGTDKVDYSASSVRVRVFLNGVADDGPYNTSSEGDNVLNTEWLIGSDYNDTLDASYVNYSVTIQGGAGNDTISGGSAQDLLEGGSGTDSLVASAGGDTWIS